MAVIPVQGTVEGDFVLNLVAIDDQDSEMEVAQKIAAHSVDRRVAAQDRPMVVRVNGDQLAEGCTPAQAGVQPMDFLEVSYQ